MNDKSDGTCGLETVRDRARSAAMLDDSVAPGAIDAALEELGFATRAWYNAGCPGYRADAKRIAEFEAERDGLKAELEALRAKVAQHDLEALGRSPFAGARDVHPVATPEPDPTPGTGDVWAEVIAGEQHPGLRQAWEARRNFGIAKYGQPLRRGDGRDHRVDLLQEIADGVAYARAAGMKRAESMLRGLAVTVLAEIEMVAWSRDVTDGHPVLPGVDDAQPVSPAFEFDPVGAVERVTGLNLVYSPTVITLASSDGVIADVWVDSAMCGHPDHGWDVYLPCERSHGPQCGDDGLTLAMLGVLRAYWDAPHLLPGGAPGMKALTAEERRALGVEG